MELHTMALAAPVPSRFRSVPTPVFASRGARTVAHALVVHHADVVRAGVSALLTGSSLCEVSNAASVFEAFRVAAHGHPQLVLFDYTQGEGAESTRLLAGVWPHPRLIALVGRGVAIDPADPLAAGADAVIAIDNVSRETFVAVVQRTLDGATPVVAGFGAGNATPARAAGASPIDPRAALDDDPTAILTRREREMLFLIGEGLSNKEIAEALVLSVKTIEAHRANLSRKLNVRSRAGLMRLAMTTGASAFGRGPSLAGSVA
jgi:DNA-binding NarL/FixJ family response regulator